MPAAKVSFAVLLFEFLRICIPFYVLALIRLIAYLRLCNRRALMRWKRERRKENEEPKKENTDERLPEIYSCSSPIAQYIIYQNAYAWTQNTKNLIKKKYENANNHIIMRDSRWFAAARSSTRRIGCATKDEELCRKIIRANQQTWMGTQKARMSFSNVSCAVCSGVWGSTIIILVVSVVVPESKLHYTCN